jgi:hypothetical protein
MATVKISELPAILGANTATTDVIPIVDVSGNITNKITRAEFFSNVGNLSGVGTITGATTLSLLTTTTSALTLDSGTTGAINIGTNANAKTITIGNGTGATSLVLNAGTGALNIGTNAIARTTSVGNTTGASVLNLQAGTGGVSVLTGTTGAVTVDSGTTGAINIGTNANAKTITVGNGTGATSVVLNAGTGAINIGTNAIARTTTVGNTTGASTLNLQAGTGGVSVLTGTTGVVTVDSGTTGAINIGTNANAKTVTVGNGTGATSVVLNAGTGPINIGTNAIARTITVGNATGASALALNAGTGHIVMTGNVGLGITPTQKLHVSGNILSTGSIDAGTQFLGQPADTATAPSFSFTGDTDVGMFRPTTDVIGFTTAGVERLRIAASGNVGIGTSSPTQPLTVAGNIYVNGADGEGLIFNGSMGIFRASSTSLAFNTGGTERMRIDSSGNVGIGTSSPTGLLTIGTSAPRLDFLETGGSAGFDNTVLIRDADVFAIQTRNGGTFVSNDYRITSNASGALTHEWRIGNTERMRINSSGFVGIGTDTPNMPLDVTSTGAGSTIISRFYITDSTIGVLRVANSTTGDGSTAPSFGSNETSAIINTNNTERLRIDSSGNLGIGNTAPVVPLHVTGDTMTTGVVYKNQPAQASKAAAATLTIAELLTGIIQYTGAAATLTLPTGTLIEGGTPNSFPVNMSFDFSVINTGTGTVTLGTAAGLTLVGAMTTAISTSTMFRVRKTATNTYTIYRIS